MVVIVFYQEMYVILIWFLENNEEHSLIVNNGMIGE